jgi:branched-chain amino acid transport system permease protein
MGALAVGLGFAPLAFNPDTVQKLTTLLTLVILASMWNALAGYGGMVSVGQQAFIGIGAYGTVFLAGLGISPYAAMVLAALVSGAIALPISLFALRLRAAQFAIGMWVIAEVFGILATLDSALGAGTGISLIELNQYPPAYQQAFTYWMALGSAVLLVLVLFLLLRGRMGVSLQAIRDDEGSGSCSCSPPPAAAPRVR